MEFFPDRAHLRLRNPVNGAYLYAMEDGVGITLRRRSRTRNEAWAVHRVELNGANYVLLHSAAYGRYLAIVCEEAAPAPSSGQGAGASHICRVVQRAYDAPGQDDVLWEVRCVDDGSGEVQMRNPTYGATGYYDGQKKWMRVMVEAIPPRADPPEHPLPVISWMRWQQQFPIVGRLRRQCQGVQGQPVLRRRIYYVRADDQGNFNSDAWRMLWFLDRSVWHLRRDLAAQVGVGEANALDITLCVRAGSNGRLTPLVIDLPSDEQAMHVVVLNTDSPAAEALVHPDVGAP
ncbi:hypothetical protein Zm00014a_041825 [Zea mays]|uniref:Uncharacterized protein n=1 Tax=Zea mays TaxID=4577 RepID=A0A3L6DHU7_MAIZE|nr:hypothetical protein Zm00014a_041825 [Zea mays]